MNRFEKRTRRKELKNQSSKLSQSEEVKHALIPKISGLILSLFLNLFTPGVLFSEPIDLADLTSLKEEFQSTDENIHSLLIERRGKLLTELYKDGSDKSLMTNGGIGNLWGRQTHFDVDTLHDMRSISKSVTSLVYGILLHQGKVPTIETSALRAFPSVFADMQPGQRGITIEHLLTMSSGLDWEEWVSPVRSDELRLIWKDDPVRFLFDREMSLKPGYVFNYNGGHTAVLAEIIRQSTHKSLDEVAYEELFKPMGIEKWEWAKDLEDRPISYAGLRLRPVDMVKIGRMVLDGGRVNGKQIVPKDWILKSTKIQMNTNAKFLMHSQSQVGYGYHWWTGKTELKHRPIDWIAAVGNGGQRIQIIPELDMVVVTTAGDYGSPLMQQKVGRLVEKAIEAQLD